MFLSDRHENLKKPKTLGPNTFYTDIRNAKQCQSTKYFFYHGQCYFVNGANHDISM